MFVLGTSGCAKKMAENWMLNYAERQLACPKKEIQNTTLVERQYHEVQGCGSQDRIVEYCVAGVGCKYASISELMKRASFDMDCEQSDIEIVRIDQTTFGVKGCEQRATYKLTFDGWILNAATDGVGAGANDSTNAPVGE